MPKDTDLAPTQQEAPAALMTLAGRNFDHAYIQRPRRWLAVILIAYLLVAGQYAVRTPAWQAPDEPAHYNYIAQIAATGRLPVLEPGDYSQSRLNHLLAERFANPGAIEQVQYEDYQPPLYYILVTPVFWLTGGSLIALRLFSVLLGAITLLLLYRCLEVVFPEKPLISVTATAFAAMLPMHVAMSASVNNDNLSEALIMAAFLMLLQWMHGVYYRSGKDNAAPASDASPRQTRRLIWLGVLLGLGMATKFYAYLLAPVVVLVVFVVAWLRPRADPQRAGSAASASGPGRAAGQALRVIGPAFLIGLPVWLRNMRLYGPGDPLGLARHDAVVVGQPATADWIAHNGWVAYSERAFSFTFNSFWGVFGWMGVFMDERIYTALLIFTGVIFLGLLWATVRLISGPPDTDMNRYQTHVQILFALLIGMVFLAYLLYNAKFVQHQGRYFFWGLLPISAMFAMGWREVLHPIQGVITGFLGAVLAVSLGVTGYMSGNVDKWPDLLLFLISLLLLLQPLLLADLDERTIKRLPSSLRRLFRRPPVARLMRPLRLAAWSVPFVLLFLLNLLIPTLYLMPQLTP